MAETWSTLFTSTCLPREELGAEPEEGLFMNHRIARKPTMATAMICGMLIDVWPSAMFAIGRALPDAVFRCFPRGPGALIDLI